MTYVSSKKAQEYYQVTDQTLRLWANKNKIMFQRTKGNHRRYFVPQDNGDKIIYCRVSASKKKISKIRLNICKKNIPTMMLLKISEVVST